MFLFICFLIPLNEVYFRGVEEDEEWAEMNIVTSRHQLDDEGIQEER